MKDADDERPIREHLQEAADELLSRLEEKMDVVPRAKDGLPDRIRTIRRKIHQVRTDPERRHDHVTARGWSDDAVLCMRMLSYAGDYVASHPDIDRVGETLEKLLEDVYDQQPPPYGPREAHVLFGNPIDLTHSLDAFNQKARPVVQSLTREFEQAVQSGVETINSGLDSFGRRLFD